jgi:hypothetical protein
MQWMRQYARRFRSLLTGVAMLALAGCAGTQQPDGSSSALASTQAAPRRITNGAGGAAAIQFDLGPAPMVENRLQACQQTHDRSGECRLLERKLSDIRTPHTLDEFLSNLQWLVYTNTLVKPEFYNSDETVFRVLGGDKGGRRESNGNFSINAAVWNKGRVSGYNISETSGNSYELRFPCIFFVTMYVRNHDLGDPYNLETEEYEKIMHTIYTKIVRFFPIGWEEINDFYLKRGINYVVLPPAFNDTRFDDVKEKRIEVKYFMSHFNGHPSSDGFGKEIIVGHVRYMIEFGNKIRGNWPGLMISVKNLSD